MTSELSTRQRNLTRAVNRTEIYLNENGDLVTETLQLPSEETDRKEHIDTLQEKVQNAKIEVETRMKIVQEALSNYNAAVDHVHSTASLPGDWRSKVDANVDKALELIEKAEDFCIKLVLLQGKLVRRNTSVVDNTNTPLPSLPTIPIPKFSGKIWEWEAFWGSFNHAVHSRNMDDLTKMSYLLDALQGEAKDSIKHYEVSQRTYHMVIAHLKEKYGNRQAIIHQLLHRLRSMQLQHNSLKEEENLCEALHSIVIQLQHNGEHVDNSLLQQQILEKFTMGTQRYALEQKQRHDENGIWKTEELLQTIRQHVRQELAIEDQLIGRRKEPKNEYRNEAHKVHPIQFNSQRTPACLYCGRANHESIDCRKLQTNEQREKFIRDHDLCLNCGSPKHRYSTCKAGSCRICNKRGHHTSICRDRYQESEVKPQKEQTLTNSKETKRSHTTSKDKNSRKSSVNIVKTDENQNEDSFIYYSKAESDLGTQILAGQAKVLNLSGEKQEITEIILDTGSDRSFITRELAERLQLQDTDRIQLTINAFDTEPKKKHCGVTTLKLQDNHGEEHEITVTKIDNITKPLKRYKLDRMDMDFLSHHNIELSINPDVDMIKPELLLGCQDSFILLDERSTPNKTLPSGTKLIASKLGYLVTGGTIDHRGTSNKEINGSKESTYKTYISLSNEDTKSMEEPTQLDNNNREYGEELWTAEPPQNEEFTGSDKQEQQIQNDLIWQQFQKTIARRKDGYYVRLPWKENAHTLPDNKGMAVKRLQTTLARLKNNPNVLCKYHDTIKEQLEQGIIEEVDEFKPSKGGIVHYLAHQAVLTPSKETTKLRIVYDASAHPRMAPMKRRQIKHDEISCIGARRCMKCNKRNCQRRSRWRKRHKETMPFERHKGMELTTMKIFSGRGGV